MYHKWNKLKINDSFRNVHINKNNFIQKVFEASLRSNLKIEFTGALYTLRYLSWLDGTVKSEN